MKTRTLIGIVAAIAVLSLIFFLKSWNQSGDFKLNRPALSSGELREVIADSTDWLRAAQEKNGHFRYEYMPFLDRYVSDDNMVRQAGSLFVLGEILKADANDKLKLSGTIEKSLAYFENNSLSLSFNDRNFRCVQTKKGECGLGASSLAVVGAIDLVSANPQLSERYSALIKDYIEYILASRNPSAGFRNTIFSDDSKDDTSESSFSNGEAFLALAKYYEMTKNPEIKQLLDEVYIYFENLYGENFDNNFYLWGMAAVKLLNQIEPSDKYFDFVKSYTDNRIRPVKRKRNLTRNRCAYIEGVTSAYSVLEGKLSEREKENYLEEINTWLSKSAELQVKDDDKLQLQYNNRETEKLEITNSARAAGGFLTDFSEPVQRIDFTQHCVSAFLQKLVDIDREAL